MPDPTVKELVERLRDFATDRDWDQFHDPKNLSMALAAEVGELLAIFQWLDPAAASAVTDDPERMAKVEDELADIAIYLLQLAERLHVDLLACVDAKIDRNQVRYPEALARGTARKYTELRGEDDPA